MAYPASPQSPSDTAEAAQGYADAHFNRMVEAANKQRMKCLPASTCKKFWPVKRVPAYCHTLRQNGEKISVVGETGLHPTLLQKVM